MAGSEAVLPLIGVRAGDVPESVVVVGDPARAEAIAARLDGARLAGRNREYSLFVGTHRGVPLGVASHGVGSAGAGVCFEELCRGGARRLVRAGTCGGLQPDVTDGAIVIATGAVRDDGLTPRLVPLGFPAVASVDVVTALRRAATDAGVEPVEGIVLTSDVFYPHDVLGSPLPAWAAAGAVAVEMEVAALLVVAALHGVEAGAVLAVDGNPLAAGDPEMAGYDPHRQVVRDAVDAMAAIALDAAAR
jgi:uridine phosphorylase